MDLNLFRQVSKYLLLLLIPGIMGLNFNVELSNKNLQKLSFISAVMSISYINKKSLLNLKFYRNAYKIEKKWIMFDEYTTIYYKNNTCDTFINLP